MAFVSLCQIDELREGEIATFRPHRKSVLLVWPSGGEIRAYRGRCPHHDVPLQDAHFDGKTVTCKFHQWSFDGDTGEGIEPRGCELKKYALRLEGGVIQVELP